MPGFAADWKRAVDARQQARQAQTFLGMVHPDSHPVTVANRWVTRVGGCDIPDPLREFAAGVITAMSGDEWWTIGDFRYADNPHTYVTAVARWRRAGIEYGIEGD